MILTFYKPGANGAIRYYTIHDRQPLLTAAYALTIAWRTGDGREREKIYGFDTLAQMDKKIRELFGRRVKAGYALLYSFMREKPAGAPADRMLADAALADAALADAALADEPHLAGRTRLA